MYIRNSAVFLLAVFLLGSIGVNPAAAHRFNVALVIALTGANADQGRQFRQGFMLATTERDAHANEESDGHLGGLDVYVSAIDAGGDVSGQIGQIVVQGEIDIVAVFAPETTGAQVASLLEGKNIALLLPGQSPFAQPGAPSVAGFVSAFETVNGRNPTSQAAQGYNAARRIDAAVRAQGGAGDKAALRRLFKQTASGFAW